MKIIPFGNKSGINSQVQKTSETSNNKKDKLDTPGAKNILTNTLLLTASGLFAWLTVDTIILKKSVAKGLKPIAESITDECRKDFNKAIKHFNDWQKKDFIEMFNQGAKDAPDKTNLALQKIVEIVNKTLGDDAIKDVPADSVAGFSALFSKWLKA